MTEQPIVVISFKDLPVDERVRETIEKRSQHLGVEFREITRIEITLSEDGPGYTVHGHVTGKNTDVGTHAVASELAPAADRMLDKIEKQLRRVHDKRIFSQRRDARKDPPKRKNPE
jgi:ribosomal subunit interface protein